jgi:hypothetical protein
MAGDLGSGYLDGLPAAQQEELARVNRLGLGVLRKYLVSGQAVAFLGAGASAPVCDHGLARRWHIPGMARERHQRSQAGHG